MVGMTPIMIWYRMRFLPIGNANIFGFGWMNALITHAEQTLTAANATATELFCTAGNRRAQRFYERHGWRITRTFMDVLWCPGADANTHLVETHRYAKDL